MKGQSALLAELAEDSLFRIVPGLEQVALQHGAIRAFPAGTTIATANTQSDHLIIPLTADLRLVSAEGEYVGTLLKRRSLALKHLIESKPFPYSAQTQLPTTALFLPRQYLTELLGAHPDTLHYLRLVTRNAGIRSFRAFLNEQGVEHESIVELFSHIPLDMIRVVAGTPLDVVSPALFFIRQGVLATRSEFHTESIEIGEGAWFGGQSLVPPYRLSYTVGAVRETHLHRVELGAIEPLLNQHRLLDAVYEEPWILAPNAVEARVGRLTELPGEVISFEKLAKNGVAVDPTALIPARDDEESIVASLCNIAAFMNLPVNPARIEAGVALSDRLTLLRLAEELESFGLVTQGHKIDGGEPPPSNLPCLIWLGPRLVVILANQDDHFLAHDPARGAVRIPKRELQGLWDNHILTVQRVRSAEADEKIAARRAEQKRPTSVRERLGTVIDLVLRHRRLLFNIVGLTAMGFVFQLLNPLFLQYILDDVLTIGRLDLIWGLVAGLALCTVLSAATTLSQAYLMNEFAVRFDGELSTRFYRHALTLHPSFYQKGRVGDIIARLQEIRHIREFFSGSSIAAVIGFVSIFAYASVLFAFSASIALVALGMAALLIIIQVALRKNLNKYHKRVFEADRQATSLIAEIFAAITTVKASAAEKVLRARWERTFMEGVATRKKLEIRVNAVQTFVNIVSSAGTTGALYFACIAALKGEISVGGILAISIYLQAMLRPTHSLSSLLSHIELTNVAFDKLEEVMDAKQEESPQQARVSHTAKLRGKVRLERVSFKYAKDAPFIVRDVDLTIYPNQSVAIVGRSGSGKTTLANIIAGNVRPTNGRVFFDHYDASMLSLSSLRRQVGFVQQAYSLFGGTISSNLAYGDDAPEEERMMQSAKHAYCEEFVNRFPNRYDYTLAPRGVGLSGGQRQRLAIARVLYANPRILIMDEALSALDADSETAINENMALITEGRTALVIAHRVSTVRHADRILVIHEGQIVEDGTHRALIQRGGYYAELFEGQISADEAESLSAAV